MYRGDEFDQPYEPNRGAPTQPDDFANQLAALYSKYGREAPSPDEIQAHRGNPRGLAGVEDLLINDWQSRQPTQPASGGGGVTATGGGGGGGGISGGGGGGAPAGSLSAIFQPPAERFDTAGWNARMPSFGNAPIFQAPTFRQAPAFVEPDYEAALKDPGYTFEADQGRRQMEQSAAARGVLNGGGTLKDINAWGQNFATQRVNDVRNRARDAYQLNYQTQYTDPYNYAYRSALDSFNTQAQTWNQANTGQLAGWQTQGQVGQRQNEVDFSHAYQPFNDAWNRQIQVALA